MGEYVARSIASHKWDCISMFFGFLVFEVISVMFNKFIMP